MNINVTRSSLPPFEEYIEEIRKLWESHWLTNMGIEHKTLQAELEQFLECPHVVLYTNGHLALENVIAAMGFPAGSEVITTPFTFASTTHAIVRNGLIPVFCDVERIKEIADRYGLKVIYDAAHAFAVKYKGVPSANFGDASMFSFHATKVFNTIEGGCVCFKDDALVSTMNDMKNFGIRGTERVVFVGGNAKMSEFQAAMGLCNLRHINEELAKRKAVMERYFSHLSGVEGIKLCPPQKDVEPNYAYFPVVFDGFGADRDEVFQKLKENDIGARKYFYPITNSFECYADLPTAGAEKTPVAKYLADRVLTLPMYADLALEDVDRICEIILSLKK